MTFDEIQKDIKAESTRPSSHKDSINFKILSPNVCNWTIVDLPGMMKQPIGNMQENIKELIHPVITITSTITSKIHDRK
jgi:hypothetical protein